MSRIESIQGDLTGRDQLIRTCLHRRPRACCRNPACREAHWYFRRGVVRGVNRATWEWWRTRTTEHSNATDTFERLYRECTQGGNMPQMVMNEDGIYTKDGLTPWSEIPE